MEDVIKTLKRAAVTADYTYIEAINAVANLVREYNTIFLALENLHKEARQLGIKNDGLERALLAAEIALGSAQKRKREDRIYDFGPFNDPPPRDMAGRDGLD